MGVRIEDASGHPVIPDLVHGRSKTVVLAGTGDRVCAESETRYFFSPRFKEG